MIHTYKVLWLRLQYWRVTENAVAEDDEYRLTVVVLLPGLVRLDKDIILDEERKEAMELMKVKDADRAAKTVSVT